MQLKPSRLWNSEKQGKLDCLIVLVKTVIFLAVDHELVPGSCSGDRDRSIWLRQWRTNVFFMHHKVSVFIFLSPSVDLMSWWSNWSNVSVICGITKGLLWKNKFYTTILIKKQSYLSFKVYLEFLNQINFNANFLIQLLLVTCT